MEREPSLEKKTLLRDVAPIKESGSWPNTRASLENLVEAPLLSACQELYDKNILTTMSSANVGDLEKRVGSEPHAYICVNFGSLSPENKEIALKLGQVKDDYIYLQIKIDKNTTAEEVQEKAREIVDQFKKQPMTWAKKYTREQLIQWGAAKSDSTNEELASKTGLYLDAETENFYLNEEQARKSKEKV